MSATRTSASIRIGGHIRHDLVDPLIDVICASEVSLDWCGPPFVPETASDLADALGADGILCLVDAEREGGAFTDLEVFLSEYRIAFDRATGAAGDLDGETIRYRPEIGCTSWLADQAGEPVVVAAEVERARVLVRSALEQRAPEFVRRALSALDQVLGPAVPGLEPFVIVAGTEGAAR